MKLICTIIFPILMCLTFSGCDETAEDPKSEADRIRDLLVGSWKVDGITVDGEPTDVYDALVLTFKPAIVMAEEGLPVWQSSDTWIFTDDAGKKIKRGDGLLIDVLSVDEKELVLEFFWSETTLGGGRVSSISGHHVCRFRH